MPKHFYDDYQDTVIASDGIKALVSERSETEASMVLFLWMYDHGDYGTGNYEKAIYTFEGKKVSVAPTETGKLYISYLNE